MGKDEITVIVYVGMTDCENYIDLTGFETRKCNCSNPKTDANIICGKFGKLKGWQCRFTCESYKQKESKEDK